MFIPVTLLFFLCLCVTKVCLKFMLATQHHFLIRPRVVMRARLVFTLSKKAAHKLCYLHVCAFVHVCAFSLFLEALLQFFNILKLEVASGMGSAESDLSGGFSCSMNKSSKCDFGVASTTFCSIVSDGQSSLSGAGADLGVHGVATPPPLHTH